MDKPFGHIYLIAHVPTGRVYVGQTTAEPPQKRWTAHIYAAFRRIPRSAIALAIKKYGADQFSFDVIAAVPSKQSLDDLERAWIVALRARDRRYGFNITVGGFGGTTGRILPPETIKRIADKKRGQKVSAEGRQRMSEGQKRRYKDFDWTTFNRKLAESNRGKPGHPHSEEMKQRLSAIRKQWYVDNPDKAKEAIKKRKPIMDAYWAAKSPEEKAARIAAAQAARWPREL